MGNLISSFSLSNFLVKFLEKPKTEEERNMKLESKTTNDIRKTNKDEEYYKINSQTINSEISFKEERGVSIVL